MDFQIFKDYCIGKEGATEDFPFDDETLVLKVGSKIFALTNINKAPLQINLKCDPFIALDLRTQYPAVKPGYHMNKRHWNTVEIDGTIPDDKIFWMIDISYDLVFKGLKKSERDSINDK